MVVIGAGVGGLTAAAELAAKGLHVTVLERARAPGGKLRKVIVDGHGIDAGPTVFTMRWVIESLFSDLGENLANYVTLRPLEVLARHAWSANETLDLYADLERSADAIAEFAGSAEAARFLTFSQQARAVFETLDGPFIRSARPANPLSLARRAGAGNLGQLWRIQPFVTLWKALGSHFHDPRLRQLFGRYATYCGSSPFQAPATLILVPHVEQEGVWSVVGGMYQIAVALEQLARRSGADFRYGSEVAQLGVAGGRVESVTLSDGERIRADAVVMNADALAVANGRFGRAAGTAVPRIEPNARSLSAITWAVLAEARGFSLARHNVFFSRDYAAEFEKIFHRGRVPDEPTVYVCAQDRDTSGPSRDLERVLMLINAPANGDRHAYDKEEVDQCFEKTLAQLARCGLVLKIAPPTAVATSPADFEGLFPGTGGALYGRASHGWRATFQRPGSRTRLGGLYLAGGSTHPGPGVPMAMLSGRLAVSALLRDLTSRSPSIRVATFGGMSTR